MLIQMMVRQRGMKIALDVLSKLNRVSPAKANELPTDLAEKVALQFKSGLRQ